MKNYELWIDYSSREEYEKIFFKAANILVAIKYVEKHIIQSNYDKDIYLYKLVTDEGEINFRGITPEKRYVVEVKENGFYLLK